MKPLPSRASRILVGVGAGAALTVLCACSSPPARFYTLRGDDSRGRVASAPASTLLIDMVSVHVPASVAGSRLVVQVNPARVDVLEDDRWASPVSEEIRAALSTEVTQRSGALDVHGVPHPSELPVYRVTVSVQRFESWRDSHVLIDAVWSVQPARDQQTLTCRSVFREAVTGGSQGVVDGHRRALAKVAAQIATGIRAMGSAPVTRGTSAPTASCPVSADADQALRGGHDDAHG